LQQEGVEVPQVAQKRLDNTLNRQSMTTTGIDIIQQPDFIARKGSVGTIELRDDKGRRRTVQLDELNPADRELAEKFGYKPVRFGKRPFYA